MTQDLALYYREKGLPFQGALIGSMILRTLLYLWEVKGVFDLISLIGASLFVLSAFLVYNPERKELITTGLFRFTRHPMYTGAILMDISFWGCNAYTPFFLFSAIVFYFALVTAAYFQEKETLARYGKGAEEYYAVTPRLFFMYPWCRLQAGRKAAVS